MVEQQRYDVIETLPGGVEIRSYPEHQVISVDVRAGLSDAGNIGFRPLVSYISGYNLSGEKIAMTAPDPARAPAPTPDAGTDPRFGTCKEAIANGFGDYVSGVDPEYGWYRDADKDGIVCER